ncbi:MAG TPA: sigma-G inhibitor, Gin [Desulfotomaculum sp.]|nr:sigma-G inhibitor, Gin [Desulfotomaculum sp.]
MMRHSCVICGGCSELATGLVIRGYYICSCCEETIINLRLDDPAYEIYRSGLKRIWRWA